MPLGDGVLRFVHASKVRNVEDAREVCDCKGFGCRRSDHDGGEDGTVDRARLCGVRCLEARVNETGALRGEDVLSKGSVSGCGSKSAGRWEI
jgi:hypothetical protein